MSRFHSKNKKMSRVSEVDDDDSAEEFEPPKPVTTRKIAENLVEKAKQFLRKKKMDVREKKKNGHSGDAPTVEPVTEVIVKKEIIESVPNGGVDKDLNESDGSDDIDYDLFGDHNYHKLKENKSDAEDAVTAQTTAVTAQNTALMVSSTAHNGGPTSNGMSTSNHIPNGLVHVNRDPRCRKRAIESEKQGNNAMHAELESVNHANGEIANHANGDDGKHPNGEIANHANGEDGNHADEEKVEKNDELVGEDEDILDIYGDYDFEEQNDLADPPPKRARIEINHNQTSKTVPPQKPKPKPAEQVERPVGPFKIPKLTLKMTNNGTRVTILNDHATKRLPEVQTIPVVQRNAVPLQPQAPIEMARPDDRIPIRQRLGILKGTNPNQLARSISNNNKGIQPSIAAAMPKPATPAETASRNRILQAAQKSMMQNKRTEVISAVPAAAAEKPTISKEYTMPSFVVNPLENQPAFYVLFRDVCRKYIAGKCILEPSKCAFSHTLPDSAYFRAKLDAIGTKNVLEVYQVFVVRSSKLFTRFMPQFCDYFGAHKLEAPLTETVLHCLHSERRLAAYLSHIVDGFVKMGMPFDVALKKLLSTIPVRSLYANNAVLKLILDERNKKLNLFYNVLDKLAQQKDYVYPIESVNRIVQIFVTSTENNDELMIIIWSILTKIPWAEQQRLDSDLLAQFYGKTTSNTGGLDGLPSLASLGNTSILPSSR